MREKDSHSLVNNRTYGAKGILKKKYSLLVLLIAISLFSLFFNLGNRSLENHCYIRYAEVAREMIRSGDWIVPRLGGEIFLHKPILIIWLMAIPSYFYGSVTPFSARLPSALAALLTIIFTFLFGRKIYHNDTVGFFAGVTLLTGFEYFTQARTARADMVCAFFIVSSLFFFYLGYLGRGWKKNGWYLLSFIATALATLTKGPLEIVFPLGVIIVYLLVKKELKPSPSWGFCLGIVLFILIIVPWPLLLVKKAGMPALREAWHHADILSRHEPFYYYFKEVTYRFLPWSIFIPIMLLCFLSKKFTLPVDRTFLLSWFFSIFAALSLFPIKSYRYLLPIFPAFSLVLVGTVWQVQKLSTTTGSGLNKWWECTVWFSFIILGTGIACYPVFHWRYYHSPLFGFLLTLIFSTIFIASLIFYKRTKWHWLPIIIIGGFYLMIWQLYFWERARVDFEKSPALRMAHLIKPTVDNKELYTFNFQEEESRLDFYFDRLIPEVKNVEELEALFTQKRQIYCILPEKTYEVIAHRLKNLHLTTRLLPYGKEEYVLLGYKRP